MEYNVNEWAKFNDGIIWIDDMPWERRNRVLLPLWLPHVEHIMDKDKILEANNKTNSWLAHWTDDWDRNQSEWWWTCCDMKNYDLETIPNPNGRRAIRKSLSTCSVHRIEPKDFTNLAYDIFYKAQKSYNYSNSKIITKKTYNEIILKQSNYNGFELWGAFVNGKLASFATCLIIDNAVSLGSTKSDPDFHKYYPNNALFYHITKHYLRVRGFLYVTNGPRTLLHSTTINDFLIRMGYRKIFCRLNIELSKHARMILSSGIKNGSKYLNYLEKVFPNQTAKINGFLKLVNISKTF